jgi:hypothetical protein
MSGSPPAYPEGVRSVCGWERWERIRAVVVMLSAVLAATALALLVIASTRGTSEAQVVWFTAVAAGLALAAFVGVVVTVVVAMPGYHELRKQQLAVPRLLVRFQFPESDGTWRDVEPESTTVVRRGEFETRVRVHNAGDAVLRWGILNIQSLIDCPITAIDERPKSHYTAKTPFESGELVTGQSVPCNATVAERDFPPVHDFLYVVKVSPPTAGRWPLAAVLDGYPGPPEVDRASTRIYVEVPEKRWLRRERLPAARAR